MASSSADPDAAERAALIDRLNHFSRTTDRKTLVRFWEFERYVLRHPFAPRVRDGDFTRDQFHHSVAVETSRQSIAAFVDEVARAVELLPGAFAPPSFFDPERRFWARLKDLMVFACSRHAAAYESVLSGAQGDVNCELVTLRAQCRTQLRELREFRQQLQPQTASPDTFMRLVQEPPTQFAASLADRGVFLEDLLQVLPGFVTPSVEPVSMRTWQLASDSFVSEHFRALEEAAAEAIAALNPILKPDGDAPDFDAVCVLDAPQRDSVRLVLPQHLWDESKAVYLVAGPHSRLGAAIPSFRAIAVLRALWPRLPKYTGIQKHEALYQVCSAGARGDEALARDCFTQWATRRQAIVAQLLLVKDAMNYHFPTANGYSGSYWNEADFDEPNWQTSFWGEKNYEKLLHVKRSYDPHGVFVCHHCVGSEEWDSTGNCRA